ncbi:uncharacterized protein BDV14DRAFT_377 [Aspergillus stella-maris]|uniref:uncharacterized protein n=1 Tax=Aspergillus stella-maris TaxID=1810926 RepID=UPI003CCE4F95
MYTYAPAPLLPWSSPRARCCLSFSCQLCCSRPPSLSISFQAPPEYESAYEQTPIVCLCVPTSSNFLSDRLSKETVQFFFSWLVGILSFQHSGIIFLSSFKAVQQVSSAARASVSLLRRT